MFIYLEKAYDRVPHDVLWRCFEEKRVLPVYIGVIKDMYEGGKMSVRTPGGVINDLFIGRGLHQGSALSPFFSL